MKPTLTPSEERWMAILEDLKSGKLTREQALEAAVSELNLPPGPTNRCLGDAVVYYQSLNPSGTSNPSPPLPPSTPLGEPVAQCDE